MENIYLLSVKNVADILNISVKLAYNLFRREDFPAIKIGRRIFVLCDRFESWMEAQEIESERIRLHGTKKKT